MITFSKLGHMGNLGNQLFQYASMIGLAKKHGHQLQLPAWKYSQYFEAEFTVIARHEAISKEIKEPNFHHTPQFWEDQLTTHNSPFTCDISGWLQSEKYWHHCFDEVKQALTFKQSFIADVLKKSDIINPKSAIAISVRRGDYVNNPNYYQLPITYYLHALYNFFPNWQQRTVIIFSDDIPYCKTHFAAATNVLYAEGLNDIEQLCLMSQCKDFIIANSTFSWWGAYLGELRQSEAENPPSGGRGAVIRPAHHFAGKLAETSDSKDYYPERWVEFNHEELKFDLTDTSFTIPVAYDHIHRKQNLDLNVCMLQRDFNTNIIIGEQGIHPKFGYMQQYCRYRHFFGMQEFHRTKMLNDMARMANTEIIVNWDADVFLPPLNILLSVEALRQSESQVPLQGDLGGNPDYRLPAHDCVYPYDGRFARVQRTWFKPLEKAFDLGIFQNQQFPGMGNNDLRSVGGAIFFNKKAFIAGGMENEHMISYGPEDRERYYRFEKLAFKIKQIPGPIYHLDHYRGPNSSSQNKYFKKNHETYKQLLAMNKEELQKHITTWSWCKVPLKGDLGGHGIDIVIPLGNGSTWKNNELRYCLRSIEKHLKGYRNIYIVGAWPAFIHHSPLTIHHIPLPDDNHHNPARNIYYKILAACYNEGISENFLFFNDDYFLTSDIDAATIPHYHKEHDLVESAKKIQQSNTFRTALENTAKALAAIGHAINNFDIHVPMLFNKQKFIELMQQYDWSVPYGYTAKSLYCNSAGIDGEFMCDCKISNGINTKEIDERVSDRFVFSVGDAGLFGDMKAWLQHHYPQPSSFELAPQPAPEPA